MTAEPEPEHTRHVTVMGPRSTVPSAQHPRGAASFDVTRDPIRVIAHVGESTPADVHGLVGILRVGPERRVQSFVPSRAVRGFALAEGGFGLGIAAADGAVLATGDGGRTFEPLGSTPTDVSRGVVCGARLCAVGSLVVGPPAATRDVAGLRMVGSELVGVPPIDAASLPHVVVPALFAGRGAQRPDRGCALYADGSTQIELCISAPRIDVGPVTLRLRAVDRDQHELGRATMEGMPFGTSIGGGLPASIMIAERSFIVRLRPSGSLRTAAHVDWRRREPDLNGTRQHHHLASLAASAFANAAT